MNEAYFTIHPKGDSPATTVLNFGAFVDKVAGDSWRVTRALTVKGGLGSRAVYGIYHYRDCTLRITEKYRSPSESSEDQYSIYICGDSRRKVRRTIKFIKGLEAEVELEETGK